MKLVKDFGYITGQTGVLSVFHLGLMAWIARVLGPEGVAIYALTMSIVQIFLCLLIYGLDPAASKFIPEHRVKDAGGKLSGLILNLYLWRSGLGFLGGMVFYFSKNFISSFYKINYFQEALGCGAFLLFLFGLFYLTASCLQGLQNFRQLFFFQCIFVLCSIPAILIFFFYGQGIFSPLKGIGVGLAVSIVYGVIVIIFSIPLKAWRDIDRESLTRQSRELMAYAMPASISAIFVLLIDNMGNLIVARFVPAATVGYFAFSYRLANYYSKTNSIWEVLYLPKFSEIFSQKKVEHLLSLFSSLLKNLFLLNVIGVGVVLILSPYLVRLLAGGEFSSSVVLFQIFLLINIVRGMNPALNSLYYTYHRTGYLASLSFFNCLLQIVFLILIVPRFGVVPGAVSILLLWLLIFYYNFHLARVTLKKAFFKRETAFGFLVAGIICLYLLSIFYKGSWNIFLILPIATGLYLLFRGREEFFQIFKA